MSREAQLRERIEELQEENRQLRELLAPQLTFPLEWKLSPQQARLLAAIYRCDGIATWERLRVAIAGFESEHSDRYEQQILCFLRRKVEKHGVAIITKHCVGVILSAEGRVVIRRALDAAVSKRAA